MQELVDNFKHLGRRLNRRQCFFALEAGATHWQDAGDTQNASNSN
jgi:hypothetical protein